MKNRGDKMTNMHKNSEQILDPNKINATIDFLKEVFDKIKAKFIEMKSKNEELKYEKEVKNILKLMEEIEELINENPLLEEDELFDFQDLESMAKYILKDKELFLKHSEFILEIFKNYNNLIFSKLENEDTEDLLYSFNRKREYFYAHIYEHLGIYDDLIDDIISIGGI